MTTTPVTNAARRSSGEEALPSQLATGTPATSTRQGQDLGAAGGASVLCEATQFVTGVKLRASRAPSASPYSHACFYRQSSGFTFTWAFFFPFSCWPNCRCNSRTVSSLLQILLVRGRCSALGMLSGLMATTGIIASRKVQPTPSSATAF